MWKTWINITNNPNPLSKDIIIINDLIWFPQIFPLHVHMYFSYQNGILLNIQLETPLTSTLCPVCKTDCWNILILTCL